MSLSQFVRELRAGRIDTLEAEDFAALWAKYWIPVRGRCCPHRVARVRCDRTENNHPWFTSAGLYRGARDGKLTPLIQHPQKIEDAAFQRFLDYVGKLDLEVNWWQLKGYRPGGRNPELAGLRSNHSCHITG